MLIPRLDCEIWEILCLGSQIESRRIGASPVDGNDGAVAQRDHCRGVEVMHDNEVRRNHSDPSVQLRAPVVTLRFNDGYSVRMLRSRDLSRGL